MVADPGKESPLAYLRIRPRNEKAIKGTQSAEAHAH